MKRGKTHKLQTNQTNDMSDEAFAELKEAMEDVLAFERGQRRELKVTRMRQEIRLRLTELDTDDWLDDKDPLTVHEKALLDARLAAYAKDPDAGSTWEEVEGRIRARLSRRPNDEPTANR